MELLKVALRNIGRNSRRSLITAITVFIGVLVVCSTRGLLNGLQGEIRGSLTRKIHGDLQIHKAGYRDMIDADPYQVIFPYDDNLEQKLKHVSGVSHISPRLRVMGLLNHQKSQKSTPIMIVGITSSEELSVCPRLRDAIQQGAVLDSSREKNKSEQTAMTDDLEASPSLDDLADDGFMETSQAKAGDSQHQIMITPALMNGLKARLGDEIVILIQDKNNMQQAIVTRIVAVVDYALPTAASRMAWMDFSTLQKLTNSHGFVSEIALSAGESTKLPLLKDEITKAISQDTLLVETWVELSSFLGEVLGLQDAIFAIIISVVFIIMISAIINTSLMTVMERTREIGTLTALGYRRKHIIFLFLAESSAISLSGGISGIILTWSIISFYSIKGIIFSLPGQKVATILYPFIPVSFIILVLSLAFLSSLIASFFPAYRASRMKPVDALSST